MIKLVVLFAFLAVTSAKPSVGHEPLPVTYSASVAAIPTAVSHQYRTDVISKPVAVATYAAAPVVKAASIVAEHAQVFAPAPVVKTVVASAPTVTSYVAPAVTSYASVPITGTAYTKNVHYAEKDVVTGYSSHIVKPDLGALATPIASVTQAKVLAPARAVQTLTPTVTRVEPEVTVKKITVDVPVQTPVVNEVEVRTPTIVAQPAVAIAPVAKVASVSSYAYSAPAVSAWAAPAVSKIAYSAPAVSTWAAPAVTKVAAPVVPAISKVAYSAPAVSAWAAPASPAISRIAYSAPAVSAWTAPVAPAVSNVAYSAPAVSAWAAPVAPAVSNVAYSASAASAWATPTITKAATSVVPAISKVAYTAPAVSAWAAPDCNW